MAFVLYTGILTSHRDWTTALQCPPTVPEIALQAPKVVIDDVSSSPAPTVAAAAAVTSSSSLISTDASSPHKGANLKKIGGEGKGILDRNESLSSSLPLLPPQHEFEFPIAPKSDIGLLSGSRDKSILIWKRNNPNASSNRSASNKKKSALSKHVSKNKKVAVSALPFFSSDVEVASAAALGLYNPSLYPATTDHNSDDGVSNTNDNNTTSNVRDNNIMNTSLNNNNTAKNGQQTSTPPPSSAPSSSCPSAFLHLLAERDAVDSNLLTAGQRMEIHSGFVSDLAVSHRVYSSVPLAWDNDDNDDNDYNDDKDSTAKANVVGAPPSPSPAKKKKKNNKGYMLPMPTRIAEPSSLVPSSLAATSAATTAAPTAIVAMPTATAQHDSNGPFSSLSPSPSSSSAQQKEKPKEDQQQHASTSSFVVSSSSSQSSPTGSPTTTPTTTTAATRTTAAAASTTTPTPSATASSSPHQQQPQYSSTALNAAAAPFQPKMMSTTTVGTSPSRHLGGGGGGDIMTTNNNSVHNVSLRLPPPPFEVACATKNSETRSKKKNKKKGVDGQEEEGASSAASNLKNNTNGCDTKTASSAPYPNRSSDLYYLVASASWDKSVRVTRVPLTAEDGADGVKRSKKENTNTAATSSSISITHDTSSVVSGGGGCGGGGGGGGGNASTAMLSSMAEPTSIRVPVTVLPAATAAAAAAAPSPNTTLLPPSSSPSSLPPPHPLSEPLIAFSSDKSNSRTDNTDDGAEPSVSSSPLSSTIVSPSSFLEYRPVVSNVINGEKKLLGHAHDVLSVDFSPDDRLVVSGGRDCLIKLWSVRTGECLWTSKGKGGAMTGGGATTTPISYASLLQKSSSGKEKDAPTNANAASAINDPVFDMMTDAKATSASSSSSSSSSSDHTDWISTVRFSPKVFRSVTQTTITTAANPTTHTNTTPAKTKSPADGAKATTSPSPAPMQIKTTIHKQLFSLVSASWDGTVRVWKVVYTRTTTTTKTTKVTTSILPPPPTPVVKESVSAQTIFVYKGHSPSAASSSSSSSATSSAAAAALPPASPVTALTISPDGSLCASGSKGGAVHLWDLAAVVEHHVKFMGTNNTNAPPLPPPSLRDADVFCFSLDSSDSGGQGGRRVVARPQPSASTPVSPPATAASQASAHHALSSASAASSASSSSSVAVTQLLFSPKYFWLTVATEGGVLRIFDLENATSLADLVPETLQGPSIRRPTCTAMAWSRDGSTLFSGYTDNTIRVWRAHRQD